MNYLNPIFKINKYVYIATILLYLTVYFGMLFQIILGITQVVTAIYITYSFYNELHEKYQKRLLLYWGVISIDLFLSLLTTKMWDIPASIILFIIPMIIATFFLKLLSKIRKEINES